jgi:hypothetical protein
MFVCIATKALNDGTRGFRFNIVGIKGLTRKRNTLKRFGVTRGKCMTAYHIGKRSIYIEQSRNKTGTRRVRHFAG